MNQVAVVIGGGQTLGAVPLPWACRQKDTASRWWIFKAIKPPTWRKTPLTPSLAKARRTGLAPTPPASRACWRSPRGVDEIFGRADLLVYSAGIAKAAFISDFRAGGFRPLAAGQSGGLLPLRPRVLPPDDPRRRAGAHYPDQLQIRESGQQTQFRLQCGKIWRRGA